MKTIMLSQEKSPYAGSRMPERSIYIGTSGWTYGDWQGRFYPPDITGTERLDYYVRHFDTVELNASFYRVPTEPMAASWNRRLPAGFHMVLKGSRLITHRRKIADVDEPLDFFLNRVLPIETLKVILWQLPPSLHLDLDRLGNFLKFLKKYKKVRHAFEFRHASWWCGEAFEMLTKYDMAFCHADYLKKVSENIPDDMPFHYVRFHGIGAQRYSGDYPARMLKEWAARIKRWKRLKRDAYLFFNNDTAGYAVKNAKELQAILSS